MYLPVSFFSFLTKSNSKASKQKVFYINETIKFFGKRNDINVIGLDMADRPA